MRTWQRWTYAIAAAAVTFVTVSTIVDAVRQASWGPVESMAWLPAVLIAVAGASKAATCRRGTR